jgi:hypothetical protein
MSADNGIYIGEFPIADRKEWRVIHAQAIENCDDDSGYYPPALPQYITDLYRVLYWGASMVFDTIEQAREEAWTIDDEMRKGDFYILEYGICFIEYDRPLLDMEYGLASTLLDAYWEYRQRQKKIAEKEQG